MSEPSWFAVTKMFLERDVDRKEIKIQKWKQYN